MEYKTDEYDSNVNNETQLFDLHRSGDHISFGLLGFFKKSSPFIFVFCASKKAQKQISL